MPEQSVNPAFMGGRAERRTPQNIDAERAVLAAMIMSPEILEDALTRVKEEYFYHPRHRKVFAAIRDLYDRNTPVDQLSLADRLLARGELDEVGGKPYIIELASDSFALVNWATHADIVKRTALLRDLITAGASIMELAYDAPDDLDEVVERSERLLLNVTGKRVESNFRSLEDLMTEAYAEIEELSNRGEHIVGVPTGFTYLDKKLTGLRPGNFVIIAARPAIGKTAFALNLAINAAKAGVSIAFFSLEMSSVELAQRLIASEAHVGLQNLRSGTINPQTEWENIIRASGRLSELDFWVDDTPGSTILEIRAKARRQLRNKKKGLVVIDYLQLISSHSTRFENRNVEVGEMSRSLKILAKDLGMPVIALSQLSRAVESRPDKRPRLADLRESGSIEQDADIVMFLDRSTTPEEAERSDRPDENIANVIVAKNRSGETGDVSLVFLPQYTMFQNLSLRHDG